MASMQTLCQLTDEEKDRVQGSGYNILRVLSHGSCSLVYLCEFKKPKKEDAQDTDNSHPKKLVCKVMETVNAPKDFVQRFLPRELANLSRIRSAMQPHIIHVHSILQYKSKVMVFMRNAELGNLCDYIKNHKDTLTEKLARFWFRQLAAALAFLHTMEVVHRDIKCENILVTANYNVKLCDFGFSRLSIDARGKQVYSTTFCGSMGYAAPELLKGMPYNPKISDVWSLGVVLFAMLNSSMPFAVENPTHLWSAQQNRAYRFRTSVLSKVSKDVVNLVGEMLEPNPTERINSEDVLVSPWLLNISTSVRTLLQEDQARKVAEEIRTNGLKPMKKILESNRLTSAVEVIDDISSTPTSEQGSLFLDNK